MRIMLLMQLGLSETAHSVVFFDISVLILIVVVASISLYKFMLICKTVYNCKHVYSKKYTEGRFQSLKNLDMKDRA